MAPSNRSIFDRALEMSTNTVIQPHQIMVIQAEEHNVIQGEEHAMMQGGEHGMDVVAYPQSFQRLPGAPEPQEERVEQGAHYMPDLLLKCIMEDGGRLSVFQEFEHYLFGDNSTPDCDAPEDDSSDEETTEDENDDVAFVDSQLNPANVREQENHAEDFQYIHLDDQELTSENGVNDEVPLSDSKQELQISQNHTSAPHTHTHATLDQFTNYPSLTSSTFTVEEETVSTFNRAAEEPEDNTSEDAYMTDTSKC